MNHQSGGDEVQERAALYALGVLAPTEAASFKTHLAEGCQACQAEVRAFGAVTAELGRATSPARPRPEVRERLLTRARAAFPAPGPTIVYAAEGAWEALEVPGNAVKRLFRDPATQRQTMLVRMARGASYPSHRHADTEELYLLEGDLTVGNRALRVGDYCAASAGTVDGVASSRFGCTFLLHASDRDEVIDEAGLMPSEVGVRLVPATEGAWTPGPTEGVAQRLLLSDPARGTRTTLVRMSPRTGHHRQFAVEQVYMVEGDGYVSGHVLHAGDYYGVPAGTGQDVIHTEDGCLFLLISARSEVLA